VHAASVSQGIRTCAECGTAQDSIGPEDFCTFCLLGAAAEDEAACVGPYELLREIGRGGMGVVYLARHVLSGQHVALKRIRRELLAGESGLRLFGREIALTVRVEHPNIVSLLHVGQHAGELFYTMRVFEASLASRACEFRSPRVAAQILEQVARAVELAHTRGVLHLDLKPANILMDSQGLPHVADFGLARIVSTDPASGSETALESASEILPRGLSPELLSLRPVGTPAYMAPELAEAGLAGATTAADVYSLGAILYELLTGAPPLPPKALRATGSEPGVATSSRGERDAPKTGFQPALPAGVDRDLAAICRRCLAEAPSDRYHSALDLADDLGRMLRLEPTSARPVAWWERMYRGALRRPLLAATAAVSLLLLPMIVHASWQALRQARAQWIESVLRANDYAAEMATGAILNQLRRPMLEIESMARTPLFATLALGPPRKPAPELAPFRSEGFDILVVFDREGTLNAIWPAGWRDIVGRNYVWRDYFHGVCDPQGRESMGDAYISRSFRSENDDQYNLAISAPILREGRCIGVVLGTIVTDSALGPFELIDRGDARHRGVLFGPLDVSRVDLPGRFPEQYLVLIHDRLKPASGILLDRATSARIASTFGPPAARGHQLESRSRQGIQLEDYRDPLEASDTAWLMAMRAVGGTGFVVGVQTRLDRVTAPFSLLLRGASRVVLLVALGAGCILVILWVGRRKAQRSATERL